MTLTKSEPLATLPPRKSYIKYAKNRNDCIRFIIFSIAGGFLVGRKPVSGVFAAKHIVSV